MRGQGLSRAATLGRINAVDNQRKLEKKFPGAKILVATDDVGDMSVDQSDHHIEFLESEIETHKKRLQDLQMEFEVYQTMYEDRINAYKMEREYEKHQGDVKEAILQEILNPHPEPGPPPTGPKSLWWIEGDRMLVISSLIIMFNLYTMMMELTDEKLEIKFFWPDQLFMVFYIFELLVKGIIRQRALLCGPCSLVWWNWLDLIIVVGGVFDMWIVPFVFGSGGKSPIDARALRVLRLARLARLARVVRAFLSADFGWTEKESFQTFIMCVIAANAIVMGLETDMPQFWGWFYVEQILLMIFMFELAVRLKRWGFQFFRTSNPDVIWNWLDFTIVAGGMTDAYLLPMVELVQTLEGNNSSKKLDIGEFMMMLRLARLLRILRLARLIKSIPPLYVLIQGIAKAMQGMVWVVVLTALLIYICALLGVKLIGHGLAFGGNPPPAMAKVFPDVLDSMYVLFNLMNGATSDIEPLLAMPIMRLFIMVYTVISTWAILSILTAVVSGNMIKAQEENKKEVQESNLRVQHTRSVKVLTYLFEKADKTHDSCLKQSEFEGIVGDSLKSAMLIDACGIQKEDLKELFECLATNPGGGGEPFVSQSDFIEGLQREAQSVSERSVMRLEKHLSEMAKKLRNIQAEMALS